MGSCKACFSEAGSGVSWLVPSLPNISAVFAAAVVLALVASAFAREGKVASIDPTDIVEYETETPEVKKLIEVSLELTRRKLYYRFGSNSPEKGGMDCSGTVQCALGRYGLTNLPRSSHDFWTWAKGAETLRPTPGVQSVDDPVFKDLRPGDLLFWEGTYETGDLVPPISHVMIFLGTLKADGKGVLFGASEGRYYRGKRIDGVSVFDWDLPKPKSSSKFVGYAPIPGLRKMPVESETAQNTGNVIKTALEKLFKKSEASRP